MKEICDPCRDSPQPVMFASNRSGNASRSEIREKIPVMVNEKKKKKRVLLLKSPARDREREEEQGGGHTVEG